MFINIPTIRKRKPGTLAKTTFVNEVVDAIGLGAQIPNFGMSDRPRQGVLPNSTVVIVENNSGATVNRFGILGIDVPIILPPNLNLDAFDSQVAIKGVLTEAGVHEGYFVVSLEDIADGQRGRATISGVCWAFVNIVSTDDFRAEIQDGEYELTTGTEGSAEIIWKEPGTGADKLALIRLNSSATPSTQFYVRLIEPRFDLGFGGRNFAMRWWRGMVLGDTGANDWDPTEDDDADWYPVVGADQYEVVILDETWLGRGNPTGSPQSGHWSRALPGQIWQCTKTNKVFGDTPVLRVAGVMPYTFEAYISEVSTVDVDGATPLPNFTWLYHFTAINHAGTGAYGLIGDTLRYDNGTISASEGSAAPQLARNRLENTNFLLDSPTNTPLSTDIWGNGLVEGDRGTSPILPVPIGTIVTVTAYTNLTWDDDGPTGLGTPPIVYWFSFQNALHVICP